MKHHLNRCEEASRRLLPTTTTVQWRIPAIVVAFTFLILGVITSLPGWPRMRESAPMPFGG